MVWLASAEVCVPPALAAVPAEIVDLGRAVQELYGNSHIFTAQKRFKRFRAAQRLVALARARRWLSAGRVDSPASPQRVAALARGWSSERMSSVRRAACRFDELCDARGLAAYPACGVHVGTVCVSFSTK
jgi:hypothetical protein